MNEEREQNMAHLEATNTLLDFEIIQGMCTFSPSLSGTPVPISPDNSSFSPFRHEGSTSSDEEPKLTSLTQVPTGESFFVQSDFPALHCNTLQQLSGFLFPSSSSTSPSSSSTSSASSVDGSSSILATDAEEFLELTVLSSMTSVGSNPCDSAKGMAFPPVPFQESSTPTEEQLKRKGTKSAKMGQKDSSEKKVKTTSGNNNLPPCRVCGDVASGFHYGVNTCEACKRFFRRALKRKRHFKCRGNRKCVIKGRKNNLCGYCRFRQCLSLGMSQGAIRTGRYTHEKRAQDRQEVQRLVGEGGSGGCQMDISEAEVTQVVARLLQGHARVVTNAHVPWAVMEARARDKAEEFRLKKEVFGFDDSLSLEQYDEVFQATGLEVDERKTHMKFIAKAMDTFVHGYSQFARSVPGFSDLSLSDQENLLKLARVEVWYLSAYRGFIEDLEMFYAPNNDIRHRIELERLLGKGYTSQAFRLSAMISRLALTFEEVLLLKAVCLTFSDRCVLENPGQVDAIQWTMLRCLVHLLKFKNSAESPTPFYKVVDLLVNLRNLTELSRKALNTKHFSEAIRTNSKLVDMFLF